MQQKSINLSWSKGCLLTYSLHGDGVLFLGCAHVHSIGFQQCYLCSAPFPPRDSICPSGKASNLLGFTFLSFLPPTGGVQTPQGGKVMAFVGKSLISTVPEPRVLLPDVWELSQWLIACFMLSGYPKLMVDLLLIWNWCHYQMWFKPGSPVAVCPRHLWPQHSSHYSLHWKGLEFCALTVRRRHDIFAPKKLFFPLLVELQNCWYLDPTGSSKLQLR